MCSRGRECIITGRHTVTDVDVNMLDIDEDTVMNYRKTEENEEGYFRPSNAEDLSWDKR